MVRQVRKDFQKCSQSDFSNRGWQLLEKQQCQVDLFISMDVFSNSQEIRHKGSVKHTVLGLTLYTTGQLTFQNQNLPQANELL